MILLCSLKAINVHKLHLGIDEAVQYLMSEAIVEKVCVIVYIDKRTFPGTIYVGAAHF